MKTIEERLNEQLSQVELECNEARAACRELSRRLDGKTEYARSLEARLTESGHAAIVAERDKLQLALEEIRIDLDCKNGESERLRERLANFVNQGSTLAYLDAWMSGKTLYFVFVEDLRVEFLWANKDTGLGLEIANGGRVEWRVRDLPYSVRCCSLVFLENDAARDKAYEIVRGLLEAEKDNPARLALVVRSAGKIGLAFDRKYLDILKADQRRELDAAVTRAEADLARARRAVEDFAAGENTP